MNTYQIAELLLALAVIVVLARTLGSVARLLGHPAVVGELTAGILVGPSVLPHSVTDAIFPAMIATPLAALANVALVLFMFCVGLKLDHSRLQGKGRIAASVSLGSIVLPFALGSVLALWLARGGNHHVMGRVSFVLFIGAAMSVTAFPVLARILSDRGMQRTRVGSLALAAAAVDDVVAWCLLALVVAISGIGTGMQWRVILAVPYAVVMLFAVRPLLRTLLNRYRDAQTLTPTVLAIVLVGLLVSSYATEWMGIHFIFGAFLFGAIVPREGLGELRSAIIERIEPVNGMFLLPIFFVISGRQVDLSMLDGRAVLELFLIVTVAIVGKFAGAYAAARVQGVDSRTSATLATLMNTRGLTEIVFLTVGFGHGIIDHALYSFMVVMALVTTAMAGPLLYWIYPRHVAERDLAEVVPLREPRLAV